MYSTVLMHIAQSRSLVYHLPGLAGLLNVKIEANVLANTTARNGDTNKKKQGTRYSLKCSDREDSGKARSAQHWSWSWRAEGSRQLVGTQVRVSFACGEAEERHRHRGNGPGVFH